MSCDRYERYWLGEIDEDAFATHRQECESCREAFELDARIETEARDIPVPASAPELWSRIANDLEAEQHQPSRQRRPRVARRMGKRQSTILRVAAVVIIAVGISAVVMLRGREEPLTPQNLLTQEALDRVEAIEDQYEAAIAALESVADPVIAGADTALLLNYRDRLETIDEQIRRCKRMLEQDGANAHVRRYLLAAYKDKRATLTQVLELSQG